MRAGQTVVVLGAGDFAQFEPFVWPAMCVMRTPIGLVTEQECAARSVSWLPATRILRAARDRIASSYVLDARGREWQRDADAVASWIAVVEAATRTPCTLCFAHGAVTLTAVPLFVARRRLDVLRVRGPGVRASARVEPDDAEGAAARILHAEGVLSAPTLGALRDAYLYVKRSKHVFELRPRQPCTLCGAVIPHGPARYMVCACPPSANPLPLAHICGSCPTTEFSVLGYRFGLSEPGPTGRRTLAPVLAPGPEKIPGPDTLWSTRARIGLAVARAVFRSHREAEHGTLSPFARAMLSALRDMKLCRLVVDCLAFSPLSLCATPRQASRSLSLLVTMPPSSVDAAFGARTAECDWRHSERGPAQRPF
jgi:hypothetical protein